MEVKVEKAASSPPHSLDLFFYSTPSSPRLSSFNNLHDDHISLLSHGHDDDSECFPSAADPEFEFSGQLDMMVPPSLSSADQLFDGGIIRPLKPPPGLLNLHDYSLRSPPNKSPIKSKFKSPKQTDDPFEAALRISATHAPPVRGRDPILRGNNNRKALSRSLSPLRVSEFALLQQQQEEEQNSKDNNNNKSSKKWRLKDLFRSASEGRPGGKKYSFLSRRNSMDNEKDGSSKGGSIFRSSISGSGRPNIISAQETQYNATRSVPELKKKTSMPYRHGLLGCLGFTPILQDISAAFAS